MSNPIYDKVGKGYNTTRNADPYLTSRIYELLKPVANGKYLDAGCGTGNYLQALTNLGLNITGIDPSSRMLDEARKKLPTTQLEQTGVEQLPFQDNTFDGASATFTVHHWTDIQQGLSELYRVLKPNSNLILLSFTPEQVMGYWLCKYFPITMQRSSEVVKSIDEMNTIFTNAGFLTASTEKYFVHEELTDYFLYAHKNHPERYLDPSVRNGISSFTVYADEDEVQQGLIQLEADIQSGAIENIIKEYENDLGDYLFYQVHKQ